MELSLAGKKELPEEVFWRDLEEITSHARPVARSATETGRMEEPIRNRRKISHSFSFSFSLANVCTRAPRRGTVDQEEKRKRMTILLSLDPQKSRSSLAAHPTMSVYPVSSLFFHFYLLYFSSSFCSAALARPSVRSPLARKKQLKRLKSPKARREAKRDRKPPEFFARLALLRVFLRSLDIASRGGIAPGNCAGI